MYHQVWVPGLSMDHGCVHQSYSLSPVPQFSRKVTNYPWCTATTCALYIPTCTLYIPASPPHPSSSPGRLPRIHHSHLTRSPLQNRASPLIQSWPPVPSVHKRRGCVCSQLQDVAKERLRGRGHWKRGKVRRSIDWKTVRLGGKIYWEKEVDRMR